MEWREGDGLYVTNVRWTAAASEMLKVNEYHYISPAFGYSANGDIVRLHSAAVTNVPALDGLTDLAAATRLTDQLSTVAIAFQLQFLNVEFFFPDSVCCIY